MSDSRKAHRTGSINGALRAALYGGLSSALDFAETIDPSFGYNFATQGFTPTSGTQVIPFSRGTNATQYRQGDGWLTFAPANACINSENIQASGWAIQSGETINGTNTFTESALNEGHQISYGTITVQPGQYQTISFDAASVNGNRNIEVNSNSAAFTANDYVIFNLSNGTVKETGTAVINASIVSTGQIVNGNTVYRCTYAVPAITNTTASIFFGPALPAGTGRTASTFQGDGVSQLYINRLNIQVGSSDMGYNKTTGAAYFGPRLDYNPSTTYYDGENLFNFSEDFNNAAFTKENATVGSSPLSPSVCVTSAYKIQETATSGVHRVYGAINTAIVAGQYYTAVVYVAPAERTWTFLQLGNGANWQDSNPGIYVNLATGAVGTVNAGTKGYSITADVNGFWRVELTGLCIVNGSTSGVLIHTALGDVSQSYTGTAGFGIYAGCVSFNRGVKGSRYVYTNGSAVTGTTSLGATARGLFVEEARTNLLLWSNDYTQASWSKVDTTITANNTISPEGILNASLITEGSAGTAVLGQVSQTFVVTSIVSESVYLKRGNTDWARVQVGDPTQSNSFRVWVNLANGTLGTSNATGTGTLVGSSIVALPNGWYRVSVSGTVSLTDTAGVAITLSASADASTTRVSGATRYQYGSQLEVVPASSSNNGSSSYMPTFATTFTRNADVLSGTPTFYNTPADTIFISYITQGQSANALARGGAWRFDDGTALNDQLLLTNIAGNANYNSVTSGVSININTGTAPAALTIHKVATAAQNNDYVMYLDGAQVGVNTTNTRPTGINAFYLGSRNGDYINGWIQRFVYYPVRLQNSQLQGMTA